MVPPPQVTLSTAFWYWLKLGCLSFGGPAGQIAMMHADLVEKRRWISEQRFLHALNFCMLLPGPEATQLAVYIGWLMHRTRGGIIAGLLFLLPSLVLLIGFSAIYLVFGHLPVVAGILYGIKPAVIAIVIAAAVRIGKRTLHTLSLRLIAGSALFTLLVLQWPFPIIVISAALAGVIGGRVWPRQFMIAVTSMSDGNAPTAAIIDDASPSPIHAQFSVSRLVKATLLGAGLVIASWLAVAHLFGMTSVAAQIGWFFTKAALLTFGGAYAVLPYVYQGAVDHYHWLTASQMMDGLALGETTPGPLIMIVAFVGFIGGAAGHLPTLSPLGAGIVGALVAAWFTFLPSFIFILAGAPLVEASRNDLRLTAPLTAISAAVVGVVVSLAVFFAQQVFQLQQPVAQWDWFAVAMAAVACIAVMRYRIGTITLIVVGAIAGLMVSFSR